MPIIVDHSVGNPYTLTVQDGERSVAFDPIKFQIDSVVNRIYTITTKEAIISLKERADIISKCFEGTNATDVYQYDMLEILRDCYLLLELVQLAKAKLCILAIEAQMSIVQRDLEIKT